MKVMVLVKASKDSEAGVMPSEQLLTEMGKFNEEIGATIQEIWSTWLPTSGFQQAPSVSFERYTDEFNSQTGRDGIEIWVPIQ